jgi:hypothetical protein
MPDAPPGPGPVFSPERDHAPDGFDFEARLLGLGDGDIGNTWATVAWCSSRDLAELLVESAMERGGYSLGEVWGPSFTTGLRVALVRYDVSDPDTSV